MTTNLPRDAGSTDNRNPNEIARQARMRADPDSIIEQTSILLPYSWVLDKLRRLETELLEASDGQPRISININYIIADVLRASGVMYKKQSGLVKQFFTEETYIAWLDSIKTTPTR